TLFFIVLCSFLSYLYLTVFPSRRSSDLSDEHRLGLAHRRLHVGAGIARPTGLHARCRQGQTGGARAVAGRARAEGAGDGEPDSRSEEHTSELQSRENLVGRLLLEKKNKI